jgi:hypothetical protein
VRNRKPALFSQLIDDHKPDIVCGCESKLDNTIKSEEKLLYGLLISISFIDAVLRFIDPQGGHVHVK